MLLLTQVGLRNGYAQQDLSSADFTRFKIAVEDSILSLRTEVATVKAQRDTAQNEIYIMKLVDEKTKPGRLDNFTVGFITGIASVIATGWVLQRSWQ